MDKIKNLLNPGRTQDNEALYGTGETANTTHSNTTGTTTGGVAGEGSHFGNTRDPATNTTSHVPGAFPSGTSTNTSSGVGNTHSTGISTGTGANTTAGPHSSNIANKADPRIDSDNSRSVGHSGVAGSGVGNTHNSGISSGTGATTTAGPHSSNLGNKADPRVDSDNSRHAGQSGLTGTSGVGHNHNSGLSSGTGSTATAGPHSSNIANKADPRVDSDNSRTLGHSGATGTSSGVGNTYPAGASGTSSTTTTGPHSSNIANKADPRIDSDNSRTTGHSGISGTGTTDHNTTGLGTASGQGTHLSHDSDRNLGSNTGYTGTNTGVSGMTQGSGHHLGRDAAEIGTAGAVGEGVHHHNQHQGNLGSNTGYNSSTGQSLPHHTGSGVTGANQTSGHHLGRDAGAVGTAGAVGEGIHHHNQHQGNLGSTTSNTGVSSTGQNLPHRTGQGITGDNQTSGHHLGRDAAAVGTAGAVGEGVHHQHQGNLGTGSNTGYTGATGSHHTGPIGSAVSGPHTTATANRLDPNVNTAPGIGIEHAGQHAHGTGVGHSSGVSHSTTTSTGVGHSATGHNTTSTNHHGTSSTIDGPAPNTSGPHKQDWLNKLDPRVDAKRETTTSGTSVNPTHHSGVTGDSTRATDTSHHGSSTGHHTGRDAAVAGGVGGAAYEAGKHHHGDQSLGDPSHSSITGDTSTRTTAGPHSSNVANKADPRVDSDRSKDHHYGRDAAVTGGAGTAAYGADKHLHGHETSTNKPLPTAPGNHGIGTGAGTQNALASETNHHDRHGGAVPLSEKRAGHDLGDKLHGVDRNRGVTGDSHVPGTTGHHTGRDAAGLGAAGALGEHEHRQHHNTTDQHSGLTSSVQHSGVGQHSSHIGTGQHTGHHTGPGHDSNLTGTGTHSSHIGRDAAALGTTGAVGEHEYRQHENTTGQHSGLTGSGHHSTTGHHSNLTGTGNNQQYGTSHQSGLTGNQSNLTGTGTGHHSGTGHHIGLSEATTDQSGNPISGHNTSSGLGHSGDRNRLHKDAPSSHPSSHLHSSQDTKGGVPASGSERERMIGQGEEKLGTHTGVAHGGADSSQNY